MTGGLVEMVQGHLQQSVQPLVDFQKRFCRLCFLWNLPQIHHLLLKAYWQNFVDFGRVRA